MINGLLAFTVGDPIVTSLLRLVTAILVEMKIDLFQ